MLKDFYLYGYMGMGMLYMGIYGYALVYAYAPFTSFYFSMQLEVL